MNGLASSLLDRIDSIGFLNMLGILACAGAVLGVLLMAHDKYKNRR
jgi:hypothetical protein